MGCPIADNMNCNTEVFFVLLRKGLGLNEESGTAIASFMDDARFDWSVVYRMSARQGVLAIAWNGFEKYVSDIDVPQQPSRKLKLQWALGSERVVERYVRQREIASELAQLYADRDIRTVVLKGLAVSCYYPVPEHRECGDLDCFLMGNYEKGNILAEEWGAGVKRDFYKHSHINFKGLCVENHQFCTGIRGRRKAKELERVLQGWLNDADLKNIDGTEMLSPTADFNAVFLTKHAFTHFLTEGMVLRHVCDWALFLRSEQDNVNWERVNRVLKEHDLDRFANVMTSMAVRYFNIPVHNPIVVNDSPFTDKVMDDILSDKHGSAQNQNNVWVHRVELVRNIISGSWKYKALYGKSAFAETCRYVFSFMFEREPKL